MANVISSSDSDWRFFRLLLVGRAITCIAILLTIGATDLLISSSAETFPIVALLAILLLLTLPYYAVGETFGEHTRTASLLVIAVDTCLLTTGEYLLGGQNAIYGLPLYGILIVMAAVAHSPAAAYFIALLGSFSFAAMVAATEYEVIPRREGLIVFSLSDTFATVAVSTNFFLNLAMAIVVSSLSQVKDRALKRSVCLERELRQLNEGLERRVEEGLHEIRARNDQLQRRAQQVGLFARAVAHDVRNPLTAAGEALRLRETSNEAMKEELVAMSRESLLRADRMLVGLRDLMRSAGAQPELELVDVRTIVDEVVEELSVGQGRNCGVIRVLDGFDAVLVRPVALTHVFRNLLANALKHNQGHDNLVVEVGQRSQGEDNVTTYFVRDNGRGIAPELRDRVFSPFHRGPDAPEGGLGLGLALVDTIVTQEGGQIWVEETSPGGAAFYFTLSSSAQEVNDDL